MQYFKIHFIPFPLHISIVDNNHIKLNSLQIKNEEPNDIRGFCEMHPTVKRIVLANGGTGCTQFSRHFKDWFLSNQLKPGDNEESVKAFAKKFAKKTDNFKGAVIEVISALPVSPAAAKYSYTEKRDSWERYVYAPGLHDHERLQEAKAKGVDEHS